MTDRRSKDLYDERVKLFEKYADITVCEDNQKLEDTIESVLDALGGVKVHKYR